MAEADSPTVVAALERAEGLGPEGRGRGGLRFLDRREEATFLPWPEIAARARQCAAGLQALGIEPGQRVALILPTGPEFFAAFFGAQLAGAVPVPLYPPVRLGRLAEYHRMTAAQIRAASARIVLTEPRLRRLLGETATAARPPLGVQTVGDLPAGTFTPVAVGPEDLGLVQFSSGTTVDPKPVALTHRALMSQTALLNHFWPDSAELTHAGVSWLPLYHDMGLIGCVFPALERPAELTLIGPEIFVARPAVWLRALSRYRATVSPAPNFAYGLCVSKIKDEELTGVDLSGWRVALNGAESISPMVLRAFIERFRPFGFRPEALTPVYGLSEAALAVTFSALDRPFRSHRFEREALAREGRAVPCDGGPANGGEGSGEEGRGPELVSVGRPLPGFGLRILDEGGEEVPPGRVGRVWVTGPSLMAGYLDRPEATARALRDGWLDTGDQGFLWEGELYLTGRAKDVVLLRGRGYAPEGIERAVDGLPGLRTGCTVAASWMPEGGREEILALFVETAREVSGEQIAALPGAVCRAVLREVGLAVDEVVVLPPGTLPRTSSGKLRRGETVRRFRAGELSPPRPVNALRLAGAMARSGLAYARLRLAGPGVGDGEEGRRRRAPEGEDG